LSLIKYSADRRRILRFAALLGGAALALSWAGTTHAATTDLFLTWPGVIGTSNAAGHAGDIVITSYSQNASNTASSASTAGKAVCGQVTVTKHIDSTSPVFLGMVLAGKRTAGPVTVTFAAHGVKDTSYYTVTLHDVIPTSI